MRLFWLSFYIYCWHLHIQKSSCTLYNQTFSIHYLYLLWILDSLVVPEAPEKVIKNRLILISRFSNNWMSVLFSLWEDPPFQRRTVVNTQQPAQTRLKQSIWSVFLLTKNSVFSVYLSPLWKLLQADVNRQIIQSHLKWIKEEMSPYHTGEPCHDSNTGDVSSYWQFMVCMPICIRSYHFATGSLWTPWPLQI